MPDTIQGSSELATAAAPTSIVKFEGEVATFVKDELVKLSRDWEEVRNDIARLYRAAEIKLGIGHKQLVKTLAEKNPTIATTEDVSHTFDTRYVETHGVAYLHQVNVPTPPPASTISAATAADTLTGAAANGVVLAPSSVVGGGS